MTNRNPVFSEAKSGRVTNLVHEGTQMPAQKPIQTALQRLSENVPSEAEKERLAGDYAETPHLFAADASTEFSLALDAQRSTADAGLTGWLDALDRGSQHR